MDFKGTCKYSVIFFTWSHFWFKSWISGLHIKKVCLKLRALKSGEGRKHGLLHHIYVSFSSLLSSISIFITNLYLCLKKGMQEVTKQRPVQLRKQPKSKGCDCTVNLAGSQTTPYSQNWKVHQITGLRGMWNLNFGSQLWYTCSHVGVL